MARDMGANRQDIELLIQEHLGKLVRSKRHLVYRFPNGKCFTLSKSPSDWLAERNNLTKLNRFLGIEREVHKSPNRKPKVRTKSKPAFIGIASGVVMRNWKGELWKIRQRTKQVPE
jgi:hypothetical protein